MTATKAPEADKVTIGRYAVDSESRELVALTRRGEAGQVALLGIIDRPQAGTASGTYVIERKFSPEDDLKALVRDYLGYAEDLGHCPMSRAGIAELINRGFLGREDA